MLLRVLCAVLVLAAGSAAVTVSPSPLPRVVVVGAGLAGLSAALEAHSQGANVIVLEKEARLGGNSAKATSGFNARNDAAGDSCEAFVGDTLRAARGLATRPLVEVLCADSPASLAFIESFNLSLSDVFQLGGHSIARTHRLHPAPDGRPRPVGFTIIGALAARLEALAAAGPDPQRGSTVHIMKQTRVVQLLREDTTDPRRITGVEFERLGDAAAEDRRGAERLPAHAVIITSGGYGYNGADHPSPLLSQFAPQLAQLPTTNGHWAVGEGVQLGQRVGASLALMDQVQVHPTGFVDPKDPASKTKFLAPEALRGSGGVLLDRSSHRFVDELRARDTVTGAIFHHGDLARGPAQAEPMDADDFHLAAPRPAEAFLVLNQAAVDKFGPPAFFFYHKIKGFFTEVDGADGLAAYINSANAELELDTLPVDADVTRMTLEALAAASEGEAEDEVGRKTFHVLWTGAADSKLYVARVTPAIHYTMGGMAIDTDARVLQSLVASEGVAGTAGTAAAEGVCSADGECHGPPIPGLYAAGEATGGTHGASRLGGNSLLECVTFGRRAARAAVRDYARHLRLKAQ